MRLSGNAVRTVLSFAAVLVASLICLHQRHFTLSLVDPHSFSIMLTHKCGDLLAGSILWCAAEITLFTAAKARA